ncbi:MAG TPA: hypothetical protein DEP05_06550 [Betaproteobacteria bacterium]|nr:hypothetical protein [Betaproteobacteria bacterium]
MAENVGDGMRGSRSVAVLPDFGGRSEPLAEGARTAVSDGLLRSAMVWRRVSLGYAFKGRAPAAECSCEYAGGKGVCPVAFISSALGCWRYPILQ